MKKVVKFIYLAGGSLVITQLVNATQLKYSPEHVAYFENSSPHACVGCNLSAWVMSKSTSFIVDKDHTNFQNTNLGHTDLSYASIFSMDNKYLCVNVRYSDFSYSVATDLQLGSDYICDDPRLPYQESYDFSNSNFNNVNYYNTVISGKFFNTTFQHASIVKSSMKFQYADQADFSYANLSNSTLSGTDLDRAKFRNANLSGTTINVSVQKLKLILQVLI